MKAQLEDLERRSKLREKRFTRGGTEKNVKFAEDVRKAYSVDMRSVCRRLFGPDGTPQAILDQLAVGDKLVEDRIVCMRVADEFGWAECEEFEKDEIARNEKEEKNIKRLWKEK